MKLSTKGRYGLRALLDLALHQGEGLVLLKDIARRQEFSLPYLEHLITPLIAAGVKTSISAQSGCIVIALSNSVLPDLLGPMKRSQSISPGK